jgi:hypothetical protein
MAGGRPLSSARRSMNCDYFIRFYMVLMKYDFNHGQFFKFYYAWSSQPLGVRRDDRFADFSKAVAFDPA